MMAKPSKRVLAIMDPKEKAASAASPKSKKSMKLGYGGRSAKLKKQLGANGLSIKEVGGIIGKIARSKGAAPGQKNYHGK